MSRLRWAAERSASRPARAECTRFAGPYVEDDPQLTGRSYAIAPDGRFLMMKETERRPQHIVVIRNWASEVDRKIATP